MRPAGLLGFAQTPAASITRPDQHWVAWVAHGNYTIAQENTGHTFKVTSSSGDLKAHLDHNVIIGHKASSAATDGSLAVTELNMISEHCAAPPLHPLRLSARLRKMPSHLLRLFPHLRRLPLHPLPPPLHLQSLLSHPLGLFPTCGDRHRTRAPPLHLRSLLSHPLTRHAPLRRHHTRGLPSPAVAAAPSSTVSTSAETSPHLLHVPGPQQTCCSHHYTRDRQQVLGEPVSKPAATAAPPEATANTSSEPVSPPVAAATTPAAPARRGSLSLLILFAVLVLIIGILIPSLNRWRKRKSLARTDAPNLSLTREASSDQDKTDPQVPRKAA
jgi:hypothetical protein